MENLRQGRGDEYDRFFAKTELENGTVDEIRPEGQYLQVFIRGSWEQLPGGATGLCLGRQNGGAWS